MSKLMNEITAEDFEQSKVWEYHGNSDVTATVEPSPNTELAEDDGHVYLVSTEFHLADGTILSGFTSPTDGSGLDYMQPVIFNDGLQLTLWSEDDRLKNISRELERSTEDVYPIYWRSDVLVDGETRSGYMTLLPKL